ncbi:MAG: alpha/beta hydrolase [Gammaproteobacteria bacterium]
MSAAKKPAAYAYTAGHAPQAARDTIVFVHGAAMEHSVWSHQSRYFAYHNYNVFALDLPGHGRANGSAFDDIGELAVWLGGVIAGARGRGFHLVGHSMGALIALEAAARFAHKSAPLRSLSLVGFSYPMAVSDALLEAARERPLDACAMMTQWSHASKLGGEPVPGFWSPGMQFSMMSGSRDGALLADLRACHAYAGGEDAFARVTCPVLFLCGRRDRMAPARLAAAHAAKNENAEIVFLERCGHNILSEAPHGALRALQRHIRSAESITE